MNKGWTCVKGRFGFDYCTAWNDSPSPMVKNDAREKRPSCCVVDDAMSKVAEGLKKVKQHTP